MPSHICSSSALVPDSTSNNQSVSVQAMLLLLSAGEHGILNIWDVNTAALGPQPSRQASFSSSNTAAQSKWAHLVGDSALLEELRDYFCYAQLLAQPQDTAGAYVIIGVHVQAECCALGCYATRHILQ
jgi:hypothetical protein